MKTLKEIQDQVGRENGSPWDNIPKSHRDNLWPIVCRRAQEEALKNAAEKACVSTTGLSVLKESITDPSNIIK